MNLYGYVVSGSLMATGDGSGLPVSLTEPPAAPEGYKLKQGWRQDARRIVQTWELVPEEGTAAEAALALSRLQFMSLPDEAAYELRALADEYVDGMVCYGEGNDAGMPVTRCRYLGQLYRFIGAGTQAMQPGWNPVDAPSLWARILPGQDGSDQTGPQPWEQPDSTNGYQLGDEVTHKGRVWESTFDGDNVWEPGAVGTESLWKDKGPADGEGA